MARDNTTQNEQQPNPSELKAALTGIIETALNEYIKMDAQASAKLKPLSGKVIVIELSGWDISLYMLPDAQGIQLLTEYTAKPDTIIKGKPVALFNMSKGDGSAAILREQNISIDGDLELGQQFNQFFKQLDIDWEEKLAQTFSRFTSESNADVLAHNMGRLVRGIQQWQPQAKATLEKNIAEYLQQESQILPYAEEFEPFNKAVDTLRNDVDRLEARIERIRTTRSEQPG